MKVIISLIFGAWLVTAFSGCGVKIGKDTVFGTTDFLEQAQRAQLAHEEFTDEEKEALTKEINQ